MQRKTTFESLFKVQALFPCSLFVNLREHWQVSMSLPGDMKHPDLQEKKENIILYSVYAWYVLMGPVNTPELMWKSLWESGG